VCAGCARAAQETWIRKTPLLVLIYHGIVKGVFDYDYAPACEYLGHRSVWLNVSQEGADDIDDLREGERRSVWCALLTRGRAWPVSVR
jgi:WD repeat-containing protein 35